MLSSFPLFHYPHPNPHRLLVLAWFHDVHTCLVVSLVLLADSCSLPEERHWYEGARCVSSPVTKLKTAKPGPRVLRIVCGARRARLDVLIAIAQPPKESCRSTLQAGARRYQLVCTLVAPPMSGEYSPSVVDRPRVRRSSFTCCPIKTHLTLAEEEALSISSMSPCQLVAPTSFAFL